MLLFFTTALPATIGNKVVVAHVGGYKIYMKENTGSFALLTSVTKSTFSQSLEFTDLTKKRRFAISTVNLGGEESVLVEY